MSDVSFIGIYKNIFLKTEITLVFLNWSYFEFLFKKLLSCSDPNASILKSSKN